MILNIVMVYEPVNDSWFFKTRGVQGGQGVKPTIFPAVIEIPDSALSRWIWRDIFNVLRLCDDESFKLRRFLVLICLE